MKNAFYVLLGIALIVLTSATTVSVMTVKPAKPKSVIVRITRYGNDTNGFIYTYVKQGYIVKSSDGDGSGNWLVIMEKY
jgi:hypothetical protein